MGLKFAEVTYHWVGEALEHRGETHTIDASETGEIVPCDNKYCRDGGISIKAELQRMAEKHCTGVVTKTVLCRGTEHMGKSKGKCPARADVAFHFE